MATVPASPAGKAEHCLLLSLSSLSLSLCFLTSTGSFLPILPILIPLLLVVLGDLCPVQAQEGLLRDAREDDVWLRRRRRERQGPEGQAGRRRPRPLAHAAGGGASQGDGEQGTIWRKR